MQILEKALVHHGTKFDFAIHHLQTVTGERIERGFIDHPGSVVLIPWLPDDRLVMVRQYRHPCDRMFLELPAGTGHRDEPAMVTAVRELAEETGYRAGRMEQIMETYPLPGATNERMAFIRCQDLSEGPVQREIDEEMEVEIVPLSSALAMIDRGEICDAKTILALWLEDRRRSLRGNTTIH